MREKWSLIRGLSILIIGLFLICISSGVYAKTIVVIGEEKTVLKDENVEFQGSGEGDYYWDFDESIDVNKDGDFTNDREKTGKTVTHKFEKTGKYIVTLTVVLGNSSKTYQSKITVEEAVTSAADLWIIGMGFIIAGIVMFLAEAAIPGFFIGIPASISIVLGLIALAFPQYFFSPVSPIAAIIIGIITSLFIIYLYKFIAPPEKPVTNVGESLVGKTAIVVVDTDPTSDTKGKVKIGSSIWSATSQNPIKKGTHVVVLDYEGVHVVVEPGQKKEQPRFGS